MAAEPTSPAQPPQLPTAVSCAEPSAVRKHIGCCRFIFVVSEHNVITFDDNFSRLVINIVTVYIELHI